MRINIFFAYFVKMLFFTRTFLLIFLVLKFKFVQPFLFNIYLFSKSILKVLILRVELHFILKLIYFPF